MISVKWLVIPALILMAIFLILASVSMLDAGLYGVLLMSRILSFALIPVAVVAALLVASMVYEGMWFKRHRHVRVAGPVVALAAEMARHKMKSGNWPETAAASTSLQHAVGKVRESYAKAGLPLGEIQFVSLAQEGAGAREELVVGMDENGEAAFAIYTDGTVRIKRFFIKERGDERDWMELEALKGER